MIPDGTPASEIVIVLVVVVVVGLGLIGLLFWKTRHIKLVTAKDVGSLASGNKRSLLANIFMSIVWSMLVAIEGRARELAAGVAGGLQPIATTCKGGKSELAGQEVDEQTVNDLDNITPGEARAIIRQQARAEAIVSILSAAAAGKVKSAGDQAALIEAVSGASRTSRTNSPYTHLKAVVDDLRGKEGPQYRKLDDKRRVAGIAPEKIES